MTTLLVHLANPRPVAHISFHNGIFTDLTSAFLGGHLSFFTVPDFVSLPSDVTFWKLTSCPEGPTLAPEFRSRNTEDEIVCTV